MQRGERTNTEDWRSATFGRILCRVDVGTEQDRVCDSNNNSVVVKKCTVIYVYERLDFAAMYGTKSQAVRYDLGYSTIRSSR